jgi:methylmalonyl-CoA mutase, C-terminal domain
LVTNNASTNNRIRVLLAKPGLDGHDRGAKVVARGLRDAGMEVIYTGLRQTPENITKIAIQEDVDIICLSILSGAHLGICRKLNESIQEHGLTDLPIVVGGIVPEEDVPALQEVGIKAVFGPGSSLRDITRTVRELAENKS